MNDTIMMYNTVNIRPGLTLRQNKDVHRTPRGKWTPHKSCQKAIYIKTINTIHLNDLK